MPAVAAFAAFWANLNFGINKWKFPFFESLGLSLLLPDKIASAHFPDKF
jgi:hypothetical protein